MKILVFHRLACFKIVKVFLLLSLTFVNYLFGQSVWQWRVPMRDEQGKIKSDYANAFLWIPEKCKKLNAVILVQHNMIEEGILEHPKFRKQMMQLGIGEIWLTDNISQSFAQQEQDNAAVNRILDELADKSGYKELKHIPIIPMGHSAMATYPWNFALANKERTLAVISLKGDAPSTNLTGYGRANVNWKDKNIDGIPGLMVMGEYEWWQDRITPGFKYIEQHPNSPITWYADAGRGHFDSSEQLIGLLNLFIKKAKEHRFVEGSDALKPVDVKSGWLMESWKKDNFAPVYPAKYVEFKGNRSTASWCFDAELVKYIERVYKRQAGKEQQYLGYIQNGLVVTPKKTHANYHLLWQSQADGVTFNVRSFFADSSRAKPTTRHASNKIRIDRICGPVKKIDNTTFRIAHTRIGLNNPKRSNDIWLLASNNGDSRYKSAVQQALLTIPKNTEGKSQTIDFSPMKDQQIGVKKLRLHAVSDAGLKVSFYVKEGPVYIDNSELIFTKIPLSAKFPVKVTVVAWQIGVNNEKQKIQQATPVERSFYIHK
ncbi:hypothetical protein Pedsa_3762 [Pseudopedobacter saltans DSM 12145]|uniref:Uncharacterized protein n=1 Tax=Pseudopedobacter saltans (strain ATCC 51119 / DSM 12145 / JCM 21818 / CCUG 39354 / LMG 10337 / NBRC 100064 / NCIMB 13643) TaxID=762903 RepID=F0S6G5_PSESL|nr:hypothetical protein [Pseudopedobacter saltans]ADY54291.1 hypothetical protein Pedsa_3762 [Pseudopedobacter saltans DSM 12145]